jgi:hypothetical protein
MSKHGSVLDYVREDLDQNIWLIEDEEVKLLPEIRTQILDVVGSALDDFDIPESALEGLFVYGSILTNQYNNKTDVDVRVLLNKEVMDDLFPGVSGDDIFEYLEDQLHGIKLGDTEHPLGCSIVIEGEQDELGRTEHDAVYDVIADKLIKGPAEVEDTDPEKEFTEERYQVEVIMEYLDELLRDAKNKTIDYDVLKEAIEYVADPEKLQVRLEEKLEGIQRDMEQLVAEYEAIKEDRQEAFSDTETENPHREPGNVRHKYLERYQYLDMLKKLKKILKGGVLDEEIPDVEEALKIAHGENVTENTNKHGEVDPDIYIEKFDIGIESPDVEIWRVDGGKVRDRYYIDFTIGGHDRVYSFIPKGEVWIDDDVDMDELYDSILHELWERSFMGEGTEYEDAHEKATKREQKERKNPDETLADLEEALQMNTEKKASYEELNTWEEILVAAVAAAVTEVEAETGNKATDEHRALVMAKTKDELLRIEGDTLDELVLQLNDPGGTLGGSVKDYVYDICYGEAKYQLSNLFDI